MASSTSTMCSLLFPQPWVSVSTLSSSIQPSFRRTVINNQSEIKASCNADIRHFANSHVYSKINFYYGPN